MGFGFLGFGKKSVFFRGCLLREMERQFNNYLEIFDFLGINFSVLDGEVCCGFEALQAGDKKLARKLARKNFNLFKENKVKRLIVACPMCYYMFKEVYPELIPEWDLEVELAVRVIHERILKKRFSFVERDFVCYHDPCYLKRFGIYDEPREIIRMLGSEILECEYSREKAFCCGAGGGVLDNFPSLAKKIGVERLSHFSEHCTKIIVPCLLGYSHLSRLSDRVVEFSDFVLNKLRVVK